MLTRVRMMCVVHDLTASNARAGTQEKIAMLGTCPRQHVEGMDRPVLRGPSSAADIELALRLVC